ncbi:TetR/AcrR family transcriptional regulator [Alteromonas sp. KUL106]|uniref:TetR/AcrR family transcriptional regulator n=1 Tax=Alteromonas sp. KUL106 TaxID=2480799 RepID=UPI0013569B7E|nr:TetR/AcrR family transcriptional regulator [Alteromonas sp. KUL106]
MATLKKQGRPKSEEKYHMILHAASCLFLKEGFANTSMDTVAKESGVSKQTVYSHFDSKDALFKAAITSKCQSYQLDTQQLVSSTANSLSLTECLIKVGSQFIRLLQDPETIAIFRVIIAEAVHSPHVATLFYQAGPEASLETLSSVIEQFGQGSADRHLARQLARDYCALLRGEFHTMMLCGIHAPLSDVEIEKHVVRAAEKIIVLFNHYTQK